MEPKRRILIVDDTPANVKMLNELLREEFTISFATNGESGLALAASKDRPDLILLDVLMPNMDGYEVCHRLKAGAATRRIPVIFITSLTDSEDEAKGLALGAVDFIHKPFSSAIVKQRIHNHLKLYLYQENLQRAIALRTQQLRTGYIDTTYRLVVASEFKDEDTGSHIRRVSHYAKELAGRMGMDSDFQDLIFHASPMHDVGKVAIPDKILGKPGGLNKAEWEIMKSHTTIGARILKGSPSPYLRMATEIALCHHERWEGSGYPSGLKGEKIPFPARLMNICDQYDALRSKRPYKSALEHDKVTEILTKGDGRTLPTHFDPEVLRAFAHSTNFFAEVFDTTQDLEESE